MLLHKLFTAKPKKTLTSIQKINIYVNLVPIALPLLNTVSNRIPNQYKNRKNNSGLDAELSVLQENRN